ncbi:MAG: segregation/condensation protein A [Bdellovibrionota bacterium]
MSGLHVSLEQFEGPLALLLYLIRKEEMDIYNIPIHQITKKYLEHIQMMKKLDLEGASDFITMAATLIHIKSKMLLPQYDQEEDVNEDPRKELVQRLVEYQRYQNASKDLLDRPILNRDVWRRGFKEDIILEENQGIEIDDSGLFGLIAAFRTCVKAAQKRIHKVMKKGQSIASRIMEIRDLLIPGERRIMRDLITPEEMSKNKLLVTFLSMLELAKMGFVKVFQSEPYADIHVEPLKIIDRDVIQRAESYESQDVDAAANSILAKGEAFMAAEILAKASEVIIPDQQLELTPEAIINELALQKAAVEEVIDDSATDEDIMSAEKELGLESAEGGLEGEMISSMEPIEDIIKASLSQTTSLEIDEEIFLTEDNSEKPRDGEI